MQCSGTKIVPIPFKGKTSVRETRCNRKARVKVRIPFGAGAIERLYCTECAEKRTVSTLEGRGVHVTQELLDE